MPKKANPFGGAGAWSSKRGGHNKAGGGEGGGSMKARRGLFRQRKGAGGNNRRGSCGPKVLTLLVTLISVGAFIMLRA